MNLSSPITSRIRTPEHPGHSLALPPEAAFSLHIRRAASLLSRLEQTTLAFSFEPSQERKELLTALKSRTFDTALLERTLRSPDFINAYAALFLIHANAADETLRSPEILDAVETLTAHHSIFVRQNSWRCLSRLGKEGRAAAAHCASQYERNENYQYNEYRAYLPGRRPDTRWFSLELSTPELAQEKGGRLCSPAVLTALESITPCVATPYLGTLYQRLNRIEVILEAATKYGQVQGIVAAGSIFAGGFRASSDLDYALIGHSLADVDTLDRMFTAARIEPHRIWHAATDYTSWYCKPAELFRGIFIGEASALHAAQLRSCKGYNDLTFDLERTDILSFVIPGEKLRQRCQLSDTNAAELGVQRALRLVPPTRNECQEILSRGPQTRSLAELVLSSQTA